MCVLVGFCCVELELCVIDVCMFFLLIFFGKVFFDVVRRDNVRVRIVGSGLFDFFVDGE